MKSPAPSADGSPVFVQGLRGPLTSGFGRSIGTFSLAAVRCAATRSSHDAKKAANPRAPSCRSFEDPLPVKLSPARRELVHVRDTGDPSPSVRGFFGSIEALNPSAARFTSRWPRTGAPSPPRMANDDRTCLSRLDTRCSRRARSVAPVGWPQSYVPASSVSREPRATSLLCVPFVAGMLDARWANNQLANLQTRVRRFRRTSVACRPDIFPIAGCPKSLSCRGPRSS